MKYLTLKTAGCAAALLLGSVTNATEPPANPWLAQGAYPISHHDPGQTDSTAVDGPSIGGRVRHEQVQSVPLLWSSALSPT